MQLVSGQNLTSKDKENLMKMIELLQNDQDNILTNFLNARMPGFKATDPLAKISSLLASRNPDAIIRMDVLNNAKIPCVNVTSNETQCPNGFVLEPVSGEWK